MLKCALDSTRLNGLTKITGVLSKDPVSNLYYPSEVSSEVKHGFGLRIEAGTIAKLSFEPNGELAYVSFDKSVYKDSLEIWANTKLAVSENFSVHFKLKPGLQRYGTIESFANIGAVKPVRTSGSSVNELSEERGFQIRQSISFCKRHFPEFTVFSDYTNDSSGTLYQVARQGQAYEPCTGCTLKLQTNGACSELLCGENAFRKDKKEVECESSEYQD
ncbi:MAG: hypothetical protein EOP05_01095 [Proteobacteria bacterium]|nr:MAG: hypothetical protein EOP05_01095 [Pseudomonadota bacterium]